MVAYGCEVAGEPTDSIDVQFDTSRRDRFVLYVSSPASGQIVSALNAAKTPADVQTALAAARDELWGPGPNFPKRSSLPLALAKYANAVSLGL